MKIEEVLPKAKAIALEKGKCYLFLVATESYESARQVVSMVEERFGIDACLATVDDIEDLERVRIFELSKEVK